MARSSLAFALAATFIAAAAALCSPSTCPAPGICRSGRCVLGGAPLTKSCAAVTCPVGTPCIDGRCVAPIDPSCAAVTCPVGTPCVNGRCVPPVDPSCAAVICPVGTPCVNGRCTPIKPTCASVTCLVGTTCIDGRCISPPKRTCAAVTCPIGTPCINGRCVKPVAKPISPIPICSIRFCARKGESERCRRPKYCPSCRSRSSKFSVINCGWWVKTSKPSCILRCRDFCLIGPSRPRDSAGGTHCNECALAIASCKAKFVFKGPVPRQQPRKPSCGVTYCTLRGRRGVCRHKSRNVSCKYWHRVTKPRCGRPCRRDCLIGTPRAPRDNFGRRYCNFCILKIASCNSGFRIFSVFSGKPISEPIPVTPVDGGPFPQPPPIPVGDCSTAGSRLGPKLCPAGKTCVIFDFGFPAADRPNTGKCTVVEGTPPTCTLSLCARLGASTVCTTAETRTVTTCGAWPKRTDGNQTPDCKFLCTQQCLIRKLADNEGNLYCNGCILQAASCRSHFRLFGPVPRISKH